MTAVRCSTGWVRWQLLRHSLRQADEATNHCTSLINNQPTSGRQRMQRASRACAHMTVDLGRR